jgi:hypothetical protein
MIRYIRLRGTPEQISAMQTQYKDVVGFSLLKVITISLMESELTIKVNADEKSWTEHPDVWFKTFIDWCEREGVVSKSWIGED